MVEVEFFLPVFLLEPLAQLVKRAIDVNHRRVLALQPDLLRQPVSECRDDIPLMIGIDAPFQMIGEQEIQDHVAYRAQLRTFGFVEPLDESPGQLLRHQLGLLRL